MLLFALALTGAPFAGAQGRLSDKDVEHMTDHLASDAKRFRPEFEKSLVKSSIFKTSREKEARRTAEQLEKKSDALARRFKKSKRADGNMQEIVALAQQIDRDVIELRLGKAVTSKWERIHSEVSQLAGAFGISEPFTRTTAADPGGENSCAESAGTERARKLTEECIAVSPATRPPCNVQNPCSLIVDEIKRGCRLLGQTAPIFCQQYLSSGR